MSVCSVDYDLGPWETVTQRCCSKRNVFPTPPGLKVNNRFDVFSETWDVGGLEVLILEKPDRRRWKGRTIEVGWQREGHHRFWRSRVRDAQRHA